MVLGTCLVLYMMEPHFLKIIFFPQKWGKWAKPRFPEWIGKFSYFFLHLVYNESLYSLLYALTNLIFGKILVPGIWAKMLLTNQIVGFLNQLYLYKKMTKSLISCIMIQIHWNCGHKWVCSFWPQDSQTGSISQRN